MHSSQINTVGPATNFLTSCWLFPQKEQCRSLLADFSVTAGLLSADAAILGALPAIIPLD